MNTKSVNVKPQRQKFFLIINMDWGKSEKHNMIPNIIRFISEIQRLNVINMDWVLILTEIQSDTQSTQNVMYILGILDYFIYAFSIKNILLSFRFSFSVAQKKKVQFFSYSSRKFSKFEIYFRYSNNYFFVGKGGGGFDGLDFRFKRLSIGPTIFVHYIFRMLHFWYYRFFR